MGRRKADLTTASGRMFNAAVTWAFQASEIEASVLNGVQVSLGELQSRLLGVSQSLPTTEPRLYSQWLSQSFQDGLMELSRDVVSTYKSFAVAAARSLPRFMGRALRLSEVALLSREQIDDIDAFDEEEVESDTEEDESILQSLWGLSDEQALAIVTFLLWGQSTINETWLRYAAMQRLQFVSRLNGAVSMELATLDVASRTAYDRAIRTAAAQEIRKSVAGGAGERMYPRAANTNADLLVRTQMQAILNSVMIRTLGLNKKIMSGVTWTAVLDAITCLRCANLDGIFYELTNDGGVAGPANPLHGRCRCIYVPVLIKRPGIEQRGAVPTIVTFQDWLAQKSPEFQDGVMGKRRAQLFRSGKLKFRDFVQFRRKIPVRVRPLKTLERMVSA